MRDHTVDHTEELDFAFEHQFKRDSICYSLPENTQIDFREKVFTVLMQTPSIFDEVEQSRQIARHLSKTSRDFKIKYADQFLRVAQLESQTSNYRRCMQLYEYAIANLPQDSIQSVQAYIERAEIHFKLGRYSECRIDTETALQRLQTKQFKSTVAARDKRILKGRLFKLQGMLVWRNSKDRLAADNALRQACRYLEWPLHLQRLWRTQNTPVRDLVDIYNILAEVNWKDRSICQQYYKRAIKTAQWAAMKLGDTSLLPVTYITSAKLLARKPEQALGYISERFEATNDLYWKSSALCYIRILHERKRDFQQALWAYREAQKIQEK